MANKRPVNRVTSKRRPAAQRNAGNRVTADDLQTTKRPSAAADKPAKSGASLVRMKKAARPKPAPEASASGKSWRTAAICGGAAVVLALVAVVGFLRPGADDSNLAYVDNGATDEVKAAAQHALTTIYGYDAKGIDQFRDNARKVMTGKMLDEFNADKTLDTGIDAIKQTQTDTKATADPIGVTLLTGDRAELLVNLNIEAVKDGNPQPLASGPIVLRMEKKDGTWLASEIADK
ncbi:hypothetical protein [Nocardia crassostreae]|uniref:hypothetical protein n=1 Tax=Nocardia crassostreae TaxID=53428 RepID=UPI00082A9608|nr:hypothetical protein [Nocardia crassostreae]